MRIDKYLLLIAVPVILLVALVIFVPRAIRMYQGLVAEPAYVPRVGSRAWSEPAGSVGVTSQGPAEPALARARAATELTNPHPFSPESISRGRRAYETFCLACHGPDGAGDGPTGVKLAIRLPLLPAAVARRSDGFLYATIRNGGELMPALGHQIASNERWDLVNYLRSLAPQPETPAAPRSAPSAVPPAALPAAPARPESPAAGTPPVSSGAPETDPEPASNPVPDPVAAEPASVPAETVQQADTAQGPAQGNAVFDANCAMCHAAESRDAGIGPGLAGLYQWEPHELSDGTRHETHTDEIIRTQITNGSSMMPPLGDALSAEDLDNLISYLRSL